MGFLLEFILNLDFGKELSYISVLFSINFMYESLGSSKSLTKSQEVSRNRHLNSIFELSLTKRLHKYLSFWWFSEFMKLVSLCYWKVIRYICSYYHSFKVIIKYSICDYMIDWRYSFICQSSRLIYCWY